jgi:hypothetical protein
MIDIKREMTPKMDYFVIMDMNIPFASLSKGRANLQVLFNGRSVPRSCVYMQTGVIVQARFARDKSLRSRLDLLQVSKIGNKYTEVVLLNGWKRLKNRIDSALCLGFATCSNIHLSAFQSGLAFQDLP